MPFRAEDIAKLFTLDGDPMIAVPFGNGHINDTFFVETSRARKYILQRVNGTIFKDMYGLMNNIILVTTHIRQKVAESGGDPLRECLTVVESKNGEAFVSVGNDFWRCYVYIDNAITMQTAETPELFCAAGKAFGIFQNQLSDFDAAKLVDTIPNFHNTPNRYKNFMKAYESNAFDLAKNAREEILFVREHADLCSLLTDKLESGELPLRVTHNDTKINNVMLDRATGNPLAVVDLDTVMPGLSAYDFGDSIRSGATYAAEDEPDLAKVKFETALFDKYAEGFIGECASAFSKEEALSLYTGSVLMTFECGMRFLTDYLEGSTYFKTAYPEHNLVRCRTQFELVKQMLSKKEELEAIILKYWQK